MNAESKLKTIIREEYKRAKLINNINYLIAEQSVSRFSWDSKEAEEAYPQQDIRAAGKILDKMSRSKKENFNGKINTYMYVVEMPGTSSTTQGEKFRFFPNGNGRTIYKQENITWVVEDGELILKTQNGKTIGPLTTRKGSTTVDLSAQETEEGGSWIDTLQTVLDWAGLVPVAGDIIDIINAIIYFARQKWLDGALSCIAIIPVVGTPVKLVIKNAMKATKWASKMLINIFRKAAKPKNVAEFWTRLVKEGFISDSVMRALSENIGKLGEYIEDTRKFAKNFEFDSPEFLELLKSVDNFVIGTKEYFKTAGKIGKKATLAKVSKGIAKFSKKELDDLIRKNINFAQIIRSASASKTKIGKMIKFGLNNTPFIGGIKKAFFMDPKKLVLIGDTIRREFKQELGDPKNADRLVVIARTMDPGSLNNLGKGLFGKRIKRFGDVIQSLDDPAKLRAFQNVITKNPNDYKRIASEISDLAIDQNNIVYNRMLANSKVGIRNIMDPDGFAKRLLSDESTSAVIREMRKEYVSRLGAMGPKQLDIWSNELQDLLDKSGYNYDDQTDNADSVFISSLMAILSDEFSFGMPTTDDPRPFRGTYQGRLTNIGKYVAGLLNSIGMSPGANNIHKFLLYDLVDELGNERVRKSLKTKDLQDSYDEIMKDYEETEEFEF